MHRIRTAGLTIIATLTLALPAALVAQTPDRTVVVMHSVGSLLIVPVQRTPEDQDIPIIEREVYRRIGDHTFHFNLYLEPSECPPGEVHQNCYSLVLADQWSRYNGVITHLENEFFTLGLDRITTHRFTVSVYDAKGNLVFTITPDLARDEVCVTVEGVEPAETLCLPIDPERMPPFIDLLSSRAGTAGL